MRFRHLIFKLSLLTGSLLIAAVISELAVRAVGLADHMTTDPAFEQPADPRQPYRYRSNFVGRVHGETEIETNSFGCRDREYSIDKPVDALRVVAMGDSCTFGQAVARADTFSEVLESDLDDDLGRPAEVINFGVQGYSIRYMVDRFELDARRFSPDVALLAFIYQDLHEFREDVFIDSHGYLTKKQGGGMNPIKAYLRKSHLMYLLKNQYLKLASQKKDSLGKKGISQEYLRARLDFMTEQVERFARLCEQDGVLPIIAYIDLERTEVSDAIVTTLNERFPDLSVVNCAEVLSQFPVEEMVAGPKDAHPGVAAHAIIAAEVKAELLRSLDDTVVRAP